MQNKYKTLSNYLNANIESQTINEGFLDLIKERFFPNQSGVTDEQTTKAKGILGLFGALTAAFTPDSDPITAAYREAMKNEQAAMEKNRQDLANAAKNLEAEKIRAKSKDKVAQMNLRAAEEKKAFKARQEQVKAWGDRAKGSKIIKTKAESDAMLRTLEDLGKDLQLGDENPLKKMQDLAMQICVDPATGAARSWEEIEEAAKTDTKLSQAIEDCKSFAKEHGEAITGSLKDSKTFGEAIKTFQKSADEERTAQEEVEKTTNEFNEYEANKTAVEAVKKARADHNLAKESVEKAEKAISKFSNPFVDITSDGTTSPKSDSDMKLGFNISDETVKDEETGTEKPLIDTFIKTTTGEDGQETKFFDKDAYANYLKGKGVPEDVADKIKNNLPEKVDVTDLTTVNNTIQESLKGKPKTDGGYEEGSDVSATDLKSVSDAVGKKASEEYSALKTKLSEAQQTLKNKPDPNSDGDLADDPSDSEVTRQRKEDLRKHIEKYKSIPDEYEDPDSGTVYKKDEIFDTTTETGKKYNESAINKKNAAEERQKAIEQNKAARAESRKHAVATLEEQKEMQLTPEETEQVEELTQGLGTGESFKDGKVGYYAPDPNDPNKTTFVERPSNMTTDQEKEYIEKRDNAVLLMDPKINTGSNMKVKKVDGKWVKYDPSDPDNTTPINSEEAMQIIASRKIAEKSEATIIADKQAFASNVKKVINTETGEVDLKEYKNLPKAQREQLKNILNNPELVDKAFAGIDIGADETLAAVKKHLKPVNGETPESIDKALDAISDIDDENDDELKGRDDNEYNNSQTKEDDYEDDVNSEDDGDENEYEGDDDEAIEDKTKQKQKLKNPAKIWHRRKNKRTGKTTKSYFGKDAKGNEVSISRREYKQKVKAYQAARERASAAQSTKPKTTPMGESIVRYTRLRNWLFEHLI